ncbi:MAG: hypothetical protein IJV67_07050 [Clostridia bacterium]|nr:hypothetical protein [Clostridia bacterium]
MVRRIKCLSFLCVAVILFGVYYVRVTDALMSIADSDALAYLTTASYSSIYDEFSKYEGLEEFFTILKNSNGDIGGIITNGIAVNKFTSDTSLRICNELSEYAKKGVEVPLGVFSGVRAFSGYGNVVTFKIVKISSVKCDLVSCFEQAGINQVKHSLYVRVIPDVTVIAIGRRVKLDETVDVLMCENVIVGDVPDTYLGATIIH